MFSIRGLRSRILLMTLSLFYDVAFVDRLWTDPNIMKGYLGLTGIAITGALGIAYSTAKLLSIGDFFIVMAPLMVVGIVLFVVGGWGRRINIGFDLQRSEGELRSRGTVLCLLGDTRQSSSFIESTMSRSQCISGENSLKEAECYLIFASEIWFESLAKKGLSLLGEVLERRTVGELIASKDYVPSV